GLGGAPAGKGHGRRQDYQGASAAPDDPGRSRLRSASGPADEALRSQAHGPPSLAPGGVAGGQVPARWRRILQPTGTTEAAQSVSATAGDYRRGTAGGPRGRGKAWGGRRSAG